MSDLVDQVIELEPVAKLAFWMLWVIVLMIVLILIQERRVASLRRALLRKLEQIRQDWLERTNQQVSELGKRLEDINVENQRVVEESARLDRDVEEMGLEVKSAVGKIEHFESQFNSVYRAELQRALKAFDQTVVTVLGEMKGELVRGVSRIEEIQNVVVGKGELKQKLLDGGLIGDQPESGSAAPAPEPADRPPDGEPST